MPVTSQLNMVIQEVSLLPILGHDEPVGVPPEQALQYAAFVNTCLENNQSVITHCLAGIGRTGLMSMAYLIYTGMTSERAIQYLLERNPNFKLIDDHREFAHTISRLC